jgi:signal transduction histidine kinase
LALLPARLAHRIQSLRNLPFIVVSNPHISKIYNNYLHSLSTLLPWHQKRIATAEEEEQFTDVMADLVQTHSNTIPTLAQGFLECRKYIDPADVTKFLDQHLRARIGTRLIAEQHLALHMASTQDSRNLPDMLDSHIGVIDTKLRPATIVRSCEGFVAEICELKYGVRPTVIINGEVDAEFAHVPVHLEYIITELMKNAFRATVESGHEREPIEVTIAAAPDVPTTKLDSLRQMSVNSETNYDFSQDGLMEYCDSSEGAIGPLNEAAQTITLRIRDRGGGISPETLPSIWSYSFTTFNNDEASAAVNGNVDGLNALTNSGGAGSSIAGLGYGLPLGRAYAEYFGGGIAVQSMFGWGTDVYLSLQGVGKIS